MTPRKKQAGRRAERIAYVSLLARATDSRAPRSSPRVCAPKAGFLRGRRGTEIRYPPVTYVTGICGPPELTVSLTEETSSDGGRHADF
jgi:hypothetical protein